MTMQLTAPKGDWTLRGSLLRTGWVLERASYHYNTHGNSLTDDISPARPYSVGRLGYGQPVSGR